MRTLKGVYGDIASLQGTKASRLQKNSLSTARSPRQLVGSSKAFDVSKEAKHAFYVRYTPDLNCDYYGED